MLNKANNLVENKSVLAKLMASENITVQHRHVRTAYFDLKNRVLVCPIWKDMSGAIYDLLMGHEISHALHTPEDGWHDNTKPVAGNKYPNLKKFLNVIEDARIEKIIKVKYPGLAKPFNQAYQELYDQDLFKIKALKGDYSRLNLIDRINLRFKLGALANVKFSKAEQPFVDRAAALQTWDEVVQLSKDIYNFVKHNQKDKINNQQEVKKEAKKTPEQKQKDKQSDEGNSEDSDEEGDESDSDEFDDSAEEGEDQESTDASGDSDEESEDADDSTDGDDGTDAADEESEDADEADDIESEEGEAKSRGASEDHDDAEEDNDIDDGDEEFAEEPNSVTDEAFRELEETLLDKVSNQIMVMEIPNCDLKKAIIPNKMVVDTFETGAERALARNYPVALNQAEVGSKLAVAFHKRNKSYITMLVKEFEQRKNANQYARQLTAKTGEIDSNKLSRYKFSSDIFRKVTQVQKGKNHGILFFLDLSGSMIAHFTPIVEQLMIMAAFCKKVGVPFDAYGFTDGHSYGYGGNPFSTVENNSSDGLNLSGQSFCLRHLIGSDLGTNAYKRSFNMLAMLAQLISTSRKSDVNEILGSFRLNDMKPVGFHMGGTPFLQTLICAKQIIQGFQSKHHIDVCNAVFLTDGEGTDEFIMPRDFNALIPDARLKTTIVLQDPKTKQQVTVNRMEKTPYQTALTSLIGNVTGANMIGYFFSTEFDITTRLNWQPRTNDKIKTQEAFLKANGYVVAPNIGYDQYFYVNTERMETPIEMNIYSRDTDATKADQFIKYNLAKKNSRAMIKILAAELAE